MTAHSDLDSAVAPTRAARSNTCRSRSTSTRPWSSCGARPQQRTARETTASEARRIPEMLGQAPAMQEVFRAIGRLSRSSMTVLITGESGTGKELVARALHRHSPRASEPFIALNTSAFTADLLESELFGHEKGAFTGADRCARALRAGRRRHAVPRRDRRHVAAAADAAAARARRKASSTASADSCRSGSTCA